MYVAHFTHNAQINLMWALRTYICVHRYMMKFYGLAVFNVVIK